jgi:outer membrane protein assembly factor BamB
VGSEDFFVYAISTATGEVRWKHETGLGIASSPAVADDLIVIGSKDGFLYAFETQSGHLRWKTEVGEVVTAPAVIGKEVVCIQAGVTFALSRETGNVVWKAHLAGAIQSVPVLTEDTIYLASLSGEVYALR